MSTNHMWRERAGQLGICSLNVWLLIRFLQDWVRTGRVTGVIAVAGLSLGVYFAVTRRRADHVDRSWAARMIALIALLAPMAFHPLSRSPIPDVITGTLAMTGSLISLTGLLALGRCFGIVPAYRGQIVEHSIYRFVRHPLYAGYICTHLAFVLAYPAWWNVMVWIIAEGAQLQRLAFEERVLLSDPRYSTYRMRVRWRLIPGVY